MKSSVLDRSKLEDFCKIHKIPNFRIKQIYKNIFHNSILDFQEMTDLPLDFRTLLDENFVILDIKMDSIYDGEDSCKIGFEIGGGAVMESVVMYHRHEERDIHGNAIRGSKVLNRITLCVSSQYGCAVGCIFCVTGKLGFGKNLEYSQIISQILWVNNFVKNKFGQKEDKTWRKVRNVVFMGMGEPLLNYDHVVKSIGYMLDQQYLGLSKRHVTISTSGIVPGIYKLIEDNIDVMLAISLHAPTQELRTQLIPTIAKNYTLDKLMEAIDAYTEYTGNRIFYEYIMIDRITDSSATAYDLADLLKNRKAHINLIPYNPNPAMPDLAESKMGQILAFRDILEKQGLTVTVRDNHGRDLKGACGQLGYEAVGKGEKAVKISKRDIARGNI